MSRELAANIIGLARAKGLKLSIAESCTGGLLAGAITEIAGSSDVFECSYVTYSNSAKKRMLGVLDETLADYGAVSEEVAQQMAKGALSDSGTDIAVSVTGIAGPGGSDKKLEGRVCFGISSKSGVSITETQEFGALGRSEVRNCSVMHGLLLIKAGLNNLATK